MEVDDPQKVWMSRVGLLMGLFMLMDHGISGFIDGIVVQTVEHAVIVVLEKHMYGW